MKNLGTVFKFELLKILDKKAFKVSTVVLSVIIALALTIPTIMGAFGNSPFEEDTSDTISNPDKTSYGVLIEDEAVDISDLQKHLPSAELVEIATDKELREKVISEDIKTGFIVKSPTKYEYLVNNSNMIDINQDIFESGLLNLYIENSLQAQGIDYNIVNEVYNTPIESTTNILGKDGVKNYFYTYILIFALYFIILFYGQMIATSVASEKSNRSMEILVTSTSTNSLIFGKVLAGALAGIIQFGTVILVAFISYKLNAGAWGDTIDFLFDIPANVLAVFMLFGSLGYLLFLFIYGVIGALVSRTEDISTSSTPITFLFIGAFFISVMGLSNPDMLIVKIASFVPFTSLMAMFVRVSMGTVPIIQIAISLIILIATTIATGIFGARIYRLGTLMYGNPIKLSRAFRMLKDE